MIERTSTTTVATSSTPSSAIVRELCGRAAGGRAGRRSSAGPIRSAAVAALAGLTSSGVDQPRRPRVARRAHRAQLVLGRGLGAAKARITPAMMTRRGGRCYLHAHVQRLGHAARPPGGDLRAQDARPRASRTLNVVADEPAVRVASVRPARAARALQACARAARGVAHAEPHARAGARSARARQPQRDSAGRPHRLDAGGQDAPLGAGRPGGAQRARLALRSPRGEDNEQRRETEIGAEIRPG